MDIKFIILKLILSLFFLLLLITLMEHVRLDEAYKLIQYQMYKREPLR